LPAVKGLELNDRNRFVGLNTLEVVSPLMGIVTCGVDWQIDRRGEEVTGRVMTLNFRDFCYTLVKMQKAFGKTIYSQSYMVELYLCREESIVKVDGYMGVKAQFLLKNSLAADFGKSTSTELIQTPSQVMSAVTAFGPKAVSRTKSRETRSV